MKIVFGSQNRHKLEEINRISMPYCVEFILPNGTFDPVEDGTTFEENSYIKAKTAAISSKSVAMADDSGLCVDALDGAPGIYSARYASDQSQCVEKLLSDMADVENRSAEFVCALTLVDADGNIAHQCRGSLHGKIATKESGTYGFGYDPIFIPDGYDISLAEMSPQMKDSISHRNIALVSMLDYIVKNIKSSQSS